MPSELFRLYRKSDASSFQSRHLWLCTDSFLFTRLIFSVVEGAHFATLLHRRLR